MKACKCGSTEFITSPNRYDVYEIIDSKLELTETEQMSDDYVKLFCRECGEEHEW
jgi:hypothetical protein